MNPLLLLGLRWLGGAAMVLAVLGYVYHMGASSARGECNAAALQRELEIAKQDLAEIEKKHVEEVERGQQIAGRAQTNKEKADALARELEEARKKPPAPDPVPSPAPGPAPAPIIVSGKCPAPPPYAVRSMSDSDAGRLRSIRGR